ncbi:MAG: oligosaccharide flippase family protein [Victivallaceae bacterium]|nr:oligosaccharide flippase family protein [Victivallaceae bacterium]
MNSPILKNTVTNYMIFGATLVQGVLVNRWMIHYLGNASYGLWAVLWSFFGYGLLLDFGLGISAQKFTATGLFHKDINRYNMIISTIFSFHAAMSVVIIGSTVGLSFFVPQLFNVSDPETVAYCRQCLWLFGIGTAILFPFGMFPEIMVGLQAIYVRNYVRIAAKAVELLGVLLILENGLRLRSLIIFALGLMAAQNFAMAFIAVRRIKGLALRFRIKREVFREIVRFSGYMYICSLSKLVLNNLSRPMIGSVCGLSGAGDFQIAGRVPNYCSQLTQQYQENVYPLSAGLYANGRLNELKTLILNSMRWNSFIATGITAVVWMLFEQAMKALYDVESQEITDIGKLMLISLFVTQTVRSVPHRLLVMADRHKLVAWVSVIEAALNLAGYLVFLPKYGPIAIVWVVLIIKTAIGLLVTLPYVVYFFRYSAIELIAKVYLMPLLAAILPVAVLEYLLSRAPYANAWSVLLGAGALGGGLYLAAAWRLVLNGAERALLLRKIRTFYNSIRPAR